VAGGAGPRRVDPPLHDSGHRAAASTGPPHVFRIDSIRAVRPSIADFGSRLSFPRCSVAQRRVKPLCIIAKLNVARHVCAGVFTRWVHGSVDPLDLQSRVERFHLSVIETRSYSSHRMTHIELGGHLGERLTEILRTPVGVEDHLRFEVVVSRGHAQRVDDKLGAHVIAIAYPMHSLVQQSRTVAR